MQVGVVFPQTEIGSDPAGVRAYAQAIQQLGFKHLMDADTLCLFLAGGTAFGLRGPTAEMPKGDRFNPFRVGVDHIALACTDASELKRVANALAAAGIENTGAKHDETLDKDYVAFKDPDRIAWEFYMA